jgi:hypothetical protein
VASRKTKKNNMPKLLRYRRVYDVLKESETSFKSRISGMPVSLLLSEYRLISEQYGVESFKVNDQLTDRISLIYDRLAFVQKEIMETFHNMNNQLMISDYYADQAYVQKEKEKNVKVSTKSTK